MLTGYPLHQLMLPMYGQARKYWTRHRSQTTPKTQMIPRYAGFVFIRSKPPNKRDAMT